MDIKLLRAGQTAKLLGIHINTLRTLHKQGVLIPAKITDKGTRYYSEQQIKDYIGINSTYTRKTIGYCRVSSLKQKQDLERQVDRLQTYLISRGYQFEIITDIGSGINYNKKGLTKLINLVENNEVERIVVLYKDRLVRFGFELLQQICTIHQTSIEIIDNTERTKELIKELTDDIG